MADYQVIADVSRHLQELVREAVCPEILPHPEQVGLHPPRKKDAQTLLNLYLYSIRDFSAHQPERTVALRGAVRQPARALSLCYLLYFSGHAQVPLDPLAEQQAFGRLFQLFHTHTSVQIAQIHPAADSGDEPAVIAFARLDDHQKQEIWSGFSEPMRPAVYLEVGPLLINGGWTETPRVRSIDWKAGTR